LDFEVLHDQYFVFMINLKIYTIDLQSRLENNRFEIKEVDVDLGKGGAIRSLGQTMAPKIL